MSNSSELTREAIVGRRLVEIVEVREVGDGVCDMAYTFYRLDSGVAFTLPGPWADSIAAEEPPPDARPIEPPLAECLCGQEIVEVYRAAPDSDIPDDSAYLALGNGYLVTDVAGSPKGIGDEGVWVYRPGEIEASKLLPFWGRE